MSSESRRLPPRLAEERDATGTLLRRYLRQQPAINEPQAWQRLRARLGTGPRLPRWSYAVAGGAATAVAILVGWRLTRTEPISPVAVETPRPAPGAPPPARVVPAADSPPVLRIGGRALSIPAGASVLDGQAEVTLPSPGRALAFRKPSGLRIELQAGQISLMVAHQQRGQRLEVAVWPYRFVVRGTRFQVTRGRSRVQLAVLEGRVDVYRGAQLRARVRAGGDWQGSLRPPRDRQPDLVDCREVADPHAALACYRTRAARADLTAEVALHDGARLLRDTLADPDQALALLREHRTRFPRGALRTDVDLFLVELAGQRGLHREVLEVSAALLAAHPQFERAGELHLLRGTVYREGLNDWASAEAEYARAEAAPGRARPEALYWRARCLDQLGRTEQAIAAYRAAMAHPDAAHVADARRRLSALEREHPRSSGLRVP